MACKCDTDATATIGDEKSVPLQEIKSEHLSSSENHVELESSQVQTNAEASVASATETPTARRLSIVSDLKWQILLRLVTVVFLITLLLWIFQAEGGLGFDETTIFGLHALLMSLFVIFTQESILAFSAPLIGPITKKRFILKFYHAGLHFLSMVCFICGLVAIAYYKSLSPEPIVFPFYTLYSPHSWIGVALLSLWTLQVLAVGYVFVMSVLAPSYKYPSFFTYHRYLGKCVYAVGLATCAMGFQDMQSSDLAGSTPPGTNMTDMMMMNMTMAGYYPDSDLAQYASAGSLLLLISGLFTFALFLR